MKCEPNNRTSQPLLSCLWLCTHVHTKFTNPTKTGMGEHKKNKMITSEKSRWDSEGRKSWRKRRRGNQMKGKWNVRRQMVRRIVIAALKLYQRIHSIHPTMSTIYKMWKLCYLCVRAEEVNCTARQCKEMPLTHVFYTHCTVTRSLDIWVHLLFS